MAKKKEKVAVKPRPKPKRKDKAPASEPAKWSAGKLEYRGRPVEVAHGTRGYFARIQLKGARGGDPQVVCATNLPCSTGGVAEQVLIEQLEALFNYEKEEEATRMKNRPRTVIETDVVGDDGMDRNYD